MRIFFSISHYFFFIITTFFNPTFITSSSCFALKSQLFIICSSINTATTGHHTIAYSYPPMMGLVRYRYYLFRRRKEGVKEEDADSH
ncbi:hypothetical protein BJ165DRAFT_1428126 [Panaeolus papilionaceus]|nr:hypothetical protein BJ165DRAFT_1428126 [Panaeolus papilionaceus]